MASESYEFNQRQNDLIRKLAFRMSVVSLFIALSGIGIGLLLIFIRLNLIDLYNLEFHVSGEVFAVFLVVSGISGFRASVSFRKIVKTEGSDIENLMHALNDLYRSFDMQYIMIIISILFMAVSTIFIREV